ncbi:MAG: glycosyltransferase family 4 protein, partial [Cyclobacteriaceae bacterium]|nr:glycosyltransferase family 4 protein [Cyclobacteriaceae bacterium]
KRTAHIRNEEASALQEAHQRGVAAAYGPGDIAYIRDNAGVPVELCELSFPLLDQAQINPEARDFLLLGNFTTVHTRYGLEYFFQEIWPHWKRSDLPQFSTIRVVGAGKLPFNLNIPKDCQGLQFVGFAENLMEEFAQARAVLVAVPISIGFRTRVIEAWARGVPVIMDRASARGLPEVVDNKNCLVADSPAEWLNCAHRILTDPLLAKQLGSGGRQTFEQYYWCENKAAIKRYRELSLKAVAKQTPSI